MGFTYAYPAFNKLTEHFSIIVPEFNIKTTATVPKVIKIHNCYINYAFGGSKIGNNYVHFIGTNIKDSYKLPSNVSMFR